MADIKRLLNKKGWTGRELGILELTNMAVMYKQALEGKTPKPLVEEAQFRKMISSIEDRQQGQIYNGYISIHEWLSIRYNIAQTQHQQAQLQFRTLEGYIERAILAEDVYSYVQELPAIMTQKQYDTIKAERIESSFKDEDGEELRINVFNMVEQAIHFYLEKLQTEPRKPNPLKAIRKKYVAEPVESEYIRSVWCKLAGDGYYTIEDGSGRRSDKMTNEEWRDAVTTPAMKEALEKARTTAPLTREYMDTLPVQRAIARNKAIYNGQTNAEYEKEQERLDYEKGLTVPTQWHYYEEAPADLSKWDVIEQDLLLEFYPIDYNGSGSGWDTENFEENFERSMEDFVAEFKDLVTAILKDIDAHFFKGEPGLSSLPISEWAATIFDRRQLYEKDYYGERENVESNARIFAGNHRAVYNGIAILQQDGKKHIPSLDEKGFYAEPNITSSLQPHTLEGFFTESEGYATNVEIVESSRQTLLESYYSVKGYNFALELIGRYFDVPDITIFKMPDDDIEDKMDALNELVPELYAQILSTEYADNDLKARKLQVLKDLFQPIDYKALTIPEENIKAAEELLKDFKAFKADGTERFHSLLCVLPERDEEGAN